MHSDTVPSLPPAAPEPTLPPTAAARRRALRRPRHPGPRPTCDPPTEWRNRPAAWTTLPWPALQAALPGAVPVPFTNEAGETHPFEAAVALAWPANGLLTTPQRRAWNGRPMTAGPAAGLLQPRRIAQALQTTLNNSRIGEPRHWDAGTTAHGEWWALRARYPRPAGHPAAGEPVETVITVRHRIGSSRLRLQCGWRLPGSGAEIVTGDYPVRIRRGRITLQQSPQYDLLAGIADEIDASSRLLTAWSTEAVTRGTLTSWATTVISPKMTHTIAATLVALYDRRRHSTSLPDPERPTPLDTARDVAWTVAALLGAVPDIERRTALQNQILDAVSELPWWQTPTEPGERPPGPSIDLIH